jgi:hypothetical protein
MYYVKENTVIHIDSAAQSMWMTDFSDRSTWMTEFFAIHMFWSCATLGFSNTVLHILFMRYSLLF